MDDNILNNLTLSPGWRRGLLTLHVVISVGLIGADGSVIILGLTGLTSGIPELIQASYLAMELLVTTAMLPLAVASLLTGILLGLGTRWGLARYYWVLTKLILTLVTLSALVFLLRPVVHQAAAEVLRIPIAELGTAWTGPTSIAVIVGPIVALLILVSAAILGIYKPWGKIQSEET